jgi:DeoR family glycerol-3-phosphate regulon repressor
MFLKERQDAIARTIAEKGRVAVPELAERFDVTQDCIRKDLKQLEMQGLARRVYGGAVSPDPKPEREVLKRFDTNHDEKVLIAQTAYELVAADDSVFLDASSTTLALARIMAEGSKQLTVVSPMLEILRVLGQAPHVTAIGTGGAVSAKLDSFVGSGALRMLRDINFDRTFVGALGVDLETGAVTTYDMDDGSVKRMAMDNAAHTYLLADGTKFGRAGTFTFAHLEDFDGVVTDAAGAGFEETAAALEAAIISSR